jgi:hypothetical protein
VQIADDVKRGARLMLLHHFSQSLTLTRL